MVYWPSEIVVEKDHTGRLYPKIQSTYTPCLNMEKAEDQFYIWEKSYGYKPAARWIDLYEDMVFVRRESKMVHMGRVKELWEGFGDVPMDPESECLEQWWGDIFSKGTHREYVWHWFEKMFDVSVAEQLMGHEGELVYEDPYFGTLRFEIVDKAPKGYHIFDLGRRMPQGYLPLYKKPFGECIENGEIKAIRTDDAWTILEAIGYGPETTKEMEKYIFKHEMDEEGTWCYLGALRMKAALPVMKTFLGSELSDMVTD